MLQKVADGNGGRWVLKKKFAFALVALSTLTALAIKGFVIANTVEGLSVVMTAYASTSGGVLALIFGADIADKKLNKGSYDPKVNKE